MKKPLILFYPNLPLLSKNELEVLDILIEAGKLIAPIYLEQEKQAIHQINKAELEKAAKKDPTILSPYTLVEKISGKLIVTPYHIKYAQLLKPVSDKLLEASRITKNSEFGRALKMQAKALIDGTYDVATIAWLKIKKLYILDISIGPVVHFDEQLFLGKASYQAWVGVVEKEGTERINNYKNIVLSTERKALIHTERVDIHNKVKAKVLEVLLFSGLMARKNFVGVNLPMDLPIVEKYGSEITLFNQPNDLRMKEQIMPTFNKIFSKPFREGFEVEDLRRATLRYIAMHEFAHSYLYYKNAAFNLKEYFNCIYELAATILGLRMAGSLLLKDRINNKQLESMIVASLCRGFYLIDETKDDESMINYILGWAIFINFMLESGALKQAGGMAIPNFTKIFLSLHDLSNILERLLSAVTYKQTADFVKKYGKLTNFS